MDKTLLSTIGSLLASLSVLLGSLNTTPAKAPPVSHPSPTPIRGDSGVAGSQVFSPLSGGTVPGAIGTGVGTTTPGGAFSIATSTNGANTAFLLSNLGTGYTIWAEDVVSDQSPFVLDPSGRIGIGTTTPYGVFSLEPRGESSSSTPVFVAGNKGTSTISTFDAPFLYIANTGRIGIGTSSPLATTTISGHLQMGGKKPTVSACGTGTPTVVGNDNAGKVTTGGGAFSSCTVTFDAPFTNPPACFVSDESTILLVRAASSRTVLTLDVAVAFTANDVLAYHCIGYE